MKNMRSPAKAEREPLKLITKFRNMIIFIYSKYEPNATVFFGV